MPLVNSFRRGASVVLICVLAQMAVACASRREQAQGAAQAAPVAPQPPAPPSAPAAPQVAQPPDGTQHSEPSQAADSLIAQGRARFQSYKCYECHGANGEGTNDGPNLTGSRLNGEQIAAFLQHPSPDARSAGMPTIPAASPDLQALIAFVISLKRLASPQ